MNGSLMRPVLRQYGRRFAIGEIMANALARHLQLVESKGDTTPCSIDQVRVTAPTLFCRYDYFPPVYDDISIETIDGQVATEIAHAIP